MPEHPSHLSDEPEALHESPRHGFQGDRGRRAGVCSVPRSLTIAVSREAGSRGGSIARRAGVKLGWQVYSQDLLEYIAHEGSLRQDILDNLSPAASCWLEAQLDRLLREQNLSRHPSVLDMARMLLALGA